jgi:hypothetical protein
MRLGQSIRALHLLSRLPRYTTNFDISNIFIEFDYTKLLCFPDRLINYPRFALQMRFEQLRKNQLRIMHILKLMLLIIGRCLLQPNDFYVHLIQDIP